MKYNAKKIQMFFLIIVAAGCLLTNSAIAGGKVLVFGIDVRDNFPANGTEGTENDANPGIFIEQMRLMEKELNIRVTYKRAPWKRCMIYLKKGTVDGVICGSYKKERENNGVYPKTADGNHDPSRRFSDSSYYMYVKKDSDIHWDGTSFSNLNGVVGTQLGFSINPKLKKLGVKVVEVPMVLTNFKKLVKNRIVGVAAHEDTGDAVMLGFNNVKKLSVPLSTKPYYLIMSHQIYKSDPALVNAIWKASADMQGEALKKIKSKYIGKKSWADL